MFGAEEQNEMLGKNFFVFFSATQGSSVRLGKMSGLGGLGSTLAQPYISLGSVGPVTISHCNLPLRVLV